jgi:hypothetical protein
MEISLKIIFIATEKSHGSMEIHMMEPGKEVKWMAQVHSNIMMDLL